MSIVNSEDESMVLKSYNQDEFWFQDAKKLYGLFGSLRQKGTPWEVKISKMIKGIHTITDPRGSLDMLNLTGESLTMFLHRLAANLAFREYITEKERVGLMEALKERVDIPFISNSKARAFILKGILEFCRKRPRISVYDKKSYHKHRTIDELITVPLYIPLPRYDDDYLTKVYYNYEFMGRPSIYKSQPTPFDPFGEYLQLTPKYLGCQWKFSFEDLKQILDARKVWLTKDNPEMHLAESKENLNYFYGVYDAACEYSSLSLAYVMLKKKSDLSENLKCFVDKYIMYRKSIWLPEN